MPVWRSPVPDFWASPTRNQRFPLDWYDCCADISVTGTRAAEWVAASTATGTGLLDHEVRPFGSEQTVSLQQAGAGEVILSLTGEIDRLL